MKCSFNDVIQHNDTVCLPLYRRIYPQWTQATWTVNVSGYEQNPADLTAFKSKKETKAEGQMAE